MTPYDPRGSLTEGIMLGWATVLLGYILAGMVGGMLSILPFWEGTTAGVILFGLLLASPWLGLVWWVVFHLRNGSTRTAAGVGLSVLTMAGAALLLVSACHGLMWLAFRERA